MPSLRNRSYEKELLDRSDIPFDDIKRNMQELDFINTTLGGHQISIAGLKELTGNKINDTIHITEIGCGGGDNLRALRKWTEKKGIHASFTGIDINPECIAFAETVKENKDIQFTCSDYRNVNFEEQPDIIFSSLFCHHFNEEELEYMLLWMKQNCKTGFFIND